MRKYGLNNEESEILGFLKSHETYHTGRNEYEQINSLREMGLVKIKEKGNFSRDLVYEVKLTDNGKNFLKIHNSGISRLIKHLFMS
jgi:hypothetical protein